MANITVPHVRHVPNGIKTGQTITVQGNIVNKERFDINLSNGREATTPNPTCDVPLHVCSMTYLDEVILNTMINGVWGKEERHKVPFGDKSAFEYQVRMETNYYEIYYNKKSIARYAHRVPLARVTDICVSGCISLSRVETSGGGGGQQDVGQLPYTVDATLDVGSRVVVEGTVRGEGGRFSITFQTDNGDYGYYFQPRFDQKDVVCNSKLNGKWGTEDRATSFPFELGSSFQVVVHVEQDVFRSYVNGTELCRFAHVVDPQSISKIVVDGQLELQRAAVL